MIFSTFCMPQVVSAMVNNDLMSIAKRRPLKSWKESLALFCTVSLSFPDNPSCVVVSSSNISMWYRQVQQHQVLLLSEALISLCIHPPVNLSCIIKKPFPLIYDTICSTIQVVEEELLFKSIHFIMKQNHEDMYTGIHAK